MSDTTPRQAPEGADPVNLSELAELLDVSLTTMRLLVREDGFPIEKVGSNGVPYEFDPRKVKAWQEAHEERLEAEREARKNRMAQLKLELFGGTTVDESRVTLSPREQQIALRAEVDATQLARMRGELVPAAQVQDNVAAAMTVLRKEILAIGAQVAKRFDLDREAKVIIDEVTREALKRAGDALTDTETYARAGRSGGNVVSLRTL